MNLVTFAKIHWFSIVLFLLFFCRLQATCDGISPRILTKCAASVTGDSAGIGERPLVQGIRSSATHIVRQYMPSPHSELLLGVLVGINDLDLVPEFNDVVRATGTIHVVVVSGYNINLVFAAITGIFGKKYRYSNLIPAVLVTFVYAVISGLDPPVVRAWLMGTFVILIRFVGRSVGIVRCLSLSALLMLTYNPMYLFSLSFQLSFLATLGLILYGAPLGRLVFRLFGSDSLVLRDFVATVSAQVLVWPLIAFRFEQVSALSPIVNALVLWTIPMATILGGISVLVVLPFSFIFPDFTSAIAFVLSCVVYVPLEVFLRVVYLFNSLPWVSVLFAPSKSFVVGYYLVVLMCVFVFRKFK